MAVGSPCHRLGLRDNRRDETGGLRRPARRESRRPSGIRAALSSYARFAIIRPLLAANGRCPGFESQARSSGDRITLAARVGIGHDTHRLAPGGPLRLGGVEIPHGYASVGHSDADVLLHAVTDALLGAAALGDIGEMFPDTDPANRGRDSAEMLALAASRVTSAGYRIANLDCIVFAQQPKLSPHKDVGQVGVKAKTGECVGPIGREEAISAECVVLLEKSTTNTNE